MAVVKAITTLGLSPKIKIKLLVNTATEIEYLETGGILQYVFRNLVNS